MNQSAAEIPTRSGFILRSAGEQRGTRRSVRQRFRAVFGCSSTQTQSRAAPVCSAVYVLETYRAHSCSRTLQPHRCSCTTLKREPAPVLSASPENAEPPRSVGRRSGTRHRRIKDADLDPGSRRVRVGPCLKFALQGGRGAVPAALVHHHHHVGQGVYPHLLHLQVLLQELHSGRTQQRINDGRLMTEAAWKQYEFLHCRAVFL